LHPPPEVVSAYHEVARAPAEEKRQVHQARAEETERVAEAAARRKRLDLEAGAARVGAVSEAEADRDVFLARWNVRRTLGVRQELEVLGAALARLRPEQTAEEGQAVYRRLRDEALVRQARWSDDRLRLETLARTLPGGELTLVDAPPPVATFLYALEQLQSVLPRLGALDRAAPRAPRTRDEEP
jgi:hypothetical protein